MGSKKIGFLLNDFELKQDQATTYILKKLSTHVDQVYLFSVKDFKSGFSVKALHLDVNIEDSENVRIDLTGLEECDFNLNRLDAIFIRTNPARDIINDKYHQKALETLALLEKKGMPIINSPKALLKMHSKEYILELPEETIPISRVVSNMYELIDFFNEVKKVVIKPFVGTRGNGILLIDSLGEINEDLAYPLLAQEFIKDSYQADKRICLFDGEVLEIDGVKGAVKRVPAKGEFRSNVFLGGIAHPTEISDEDFSTIDLIRPWLITNGLRYVGLDLLGSKIIEINCFSPGGIQDYERFFKLPFGDYLVGSILEEL